MPSTAQTADRNVGSPRRAVIVDGNAALCKSLRLLLEREGYEVRCARGGWDALAMLHDAEADLLITDLFMPDFDGLELVAAMRKEHPLTRLIVMSGPQFSTVDYLDTAKLAGADDILRKPVRPADLLAVL